MKKQSGDGTGAASPSPALDRRTKGAMLSAAVIGVFRSRPVSAESIRQIVAESQKEHVDVKQLLEEGKLVEQACRETLRMGTRT